MLEIPVAGENQRLVFRLWGKRSQRSKDSWKKLAVYIFPNRSRVLRSGAGSRSIPFITTVAFAAGMKAT